MNYLERVDKNLLILFVITTATLLILYVIFSSILSKANKTIYEEKNIIAWIPIFNLYLLGKIAINKIFGVILVLIEFLIGFLCSIPYFQNVIPSYIVDILSLIFIFVIIILFFIVLAKYFKVKKRKRTVYVNYVSPNDDNGNNVDNNQFINKNFVNNQNDSNDQKIVGESFDLPKVDNSYLNLNKKNNDDIENLDDNS